MQDPQHKSIRKRPLIVAGLLAVLVAAASIAFSRGVIPPPNWPDFTGFQNKTLWDWLTLAVVPMTAAAVGILYSSYEKDRDVRREQEREKDIANRQQDTDLQDYFDRINGINDKGLNDSAEHSALRNAARFLTINTLKRLDQVHRRRLIRFLYDGLFIVNWQKVASGEDHFCPETAISLIEADFSQTDLSSEWISGANLNGAILRQAILKGAKLPWGYLNGTNLSEADLMDSVLDHASLAGANLEKACARRARMESADLHAAHLQFADFSGALLFNANLQDCDLSGADLSDARLDHADLFGLKFDKSTRIAHKWRTVLRIIKQDRYHDPDTTIQSLAGEDLSWARLYTNQRMVSISIYGGFVAADLSKVDMQRVNLSDAICERVKFDKSDLRNAILDRTILKWASLKNADLRGVDLRTCNLTDADLTGARVDDMTRLPSELSKSWETVPNSADEKRLARIVSTNS